MTAAKIRWAVGVIVACGAVALGGVWVADGREPPKPPPAGGDAATAGEPAVRFNLLSLDANDLADANGLNIYKFKLEVPKGRPFHVVLRELDSKDGPPRELRRFTFRRGEREGPTTLRVDFTRRDGAVGGVLLTEQKDAVFRISCPDCTPTGLATIVPVPLSGVKLTERILLVHQSDMDNTRWGVKEARLLTVVRNVRSSSPTDYPRAELLVEQE
jgi:hypothetical protein